MSLSETDKHALLAMLDNPVFKVACDIVRENAGTVVDFTRPAPDLGVLIAQERGINMFPRLLRELTVPDGPEILPGPPLPKALRQTSILRKQ